ncbi:MAG TPA: HDOD domain-containing protein [Polyangiaceae bacterium]|nr:HDOD domain-containing protein [Polyangiaceae bacterium]
METVTENILQRITRGTLSLPSMPVAAFDCLALLRQSDFSMRAAALVIEKDPALAARVLSVSNSAAFCTKEKARTVVQSIMRLGANNLRLVLFEAMAIPIYESNDPRIRRACGALWRHSRTVAACAREVASRVHAGDSCEAYLSGLLHDIGKPIVATLLVQAEHRLVGRKTELWMEPDAWMDVVQQAHRTVGVALAEKWELPDTVVGAVANCSTYDPDEPRSIVNCVRLANALAKEVGFYVGAVNAADVGEAIAVGKDVLGLDDAQLETLRGKLGGWSREGDDISH